MVIAAEKTSPSQSPSPTEVEEVEEVEEERN
jgi:hypothetical protein